MRAKTNPKSSTGRLDVFTRVVTDGSYRFDEIADGYRGPLYLEVVPLSFAVQVEEGLSLNQLRLIVGRSPLTDAELLAEHRESPLLFRNGQPVPTSDLALADGLFLSLDLRGDKRGHVGFRAKLHTPGLDMIGARATTRSSRSARSSTSPGTDPTASNVSIAIGSSSSAATSGFDPKGSSASRRSSMTTPPTRPHRSGGALSATRCSRCTPSRPAPTSPR